MTMQMYEYQLEAVKTRNDSADLVYLTGKLAIEGAEASQIALKAHYHHKPLDAGHLIEELGDALWYIANAADMLGVTLEELATLNIAKLRQRHGESYNPAHYQALNLFDGGSA